MAYYMLQTSYTPESLAYQVGNPQNVVKRTETVIGNLGGKLICTFYSLGDYDLLQIMELPDSASAASVAIMAAAGKALKSTKITVLMTVEEGLEAFKKAANAKYKAPV